MCRFNFVFLFGTDDQDGAIRLYKLGDTVRYHGAINLLAHGVARFNLFHVPTWGRRYQGGICGDGQNARRCPAFASKALRDISVYDNSRTYIEEQISLRLFFKVLTHCRGLADARIAFESYNVNFAGSCLPSNVLQCFQVRLA